MDNYATYPSLRDKTVLITGGAEGIGAAAVELFARQGARVTFLDVDEAAAAALLARLLLKSDDDCEREQQHAPPPLRHPPRFLPCDVADLGRLRACAAEAVAASPRGRVDVLVNNAGAAGAAARVPTADVSPEGWERDVNVNLRHQFFLTQAVVPSMMAKEEDSSPTQGQEEGGAGGGGGGSIINLGSITWRIPSVGVPVYAAAKAAVAGLTRTHAREFGPRGVRVNSVVPGAVATRRQREEVLTPEYRAEILAAQSLKRDLLPAEVARLILFLAADDSSAITGSSYVVDGGWVGDI